DPDWTPDFGPSHLHKTAGAIIIGARPPLIAFNVNLKSTDLELAQAIAKDIRQSNGGLSHLKAIGVELKSRLIVQVAMNLTDYEVTPLRTAFEAVQAQAALHGVEIAASEIVGLVPETAFVEAAIHALRLNRFNHTQILERKIDAVLLPAETAEPTEGRRRSEDPRRLPLSQFIEEVAAATPIPAGGAVAAVAGALASALGMMGARLSRQTVTG